MYIVVLFAAVVILSMSHVNCVGTANIMNRCNFEIYVWSVTNEPNNIINTLAPNSGFYSEEYRLNSNDEGISLKIATVSVDTVITQLEYTYHLDNPNVYYDVSNINGYPFEEWGLTLFSSIPTCLTVSCDPGVPECLNIYNKWNDDAQAVKNCDISGNLVLFLCPPQSQSSSTTTSTTTTITTTSPTLKTIPPLLTL